MVRRGVASQGQVGAELRYMEQCPGKVVYLSGRAMRRMVL
jgi:hypothetical protein